MLIVEKCRRQLLGGWLIKRIIQQLDRIERVLDRKDN